MDFEFLSLFLFSFTLSDGLLSSFFIVMWVFLLKVVNISG